MQLLCARQRPVREDKVVQGAIVDNAIHKLHMVRHVSRLNTIEPKAKSVHTSGPLVDISCVCRSLTINGGRMLSVLMMRGSSCRLGKMVTVLSLLAAWTPNAKEARNSNAADLLFESFSPDASIFRPIVLKNVA